MKVNNALIDQASKEMKNKKQLELTTKSTNVTETRSQTKSMFKPKIESRNATDVISPRSFLKSAAGDRKNFDPSKSPYTELRK
jgi:hypothetical protein